MTIGQPHSLWAISLADAKRELFERDVPGWRRAGIDVTSHSDPWCERMVLAIFLLLINWCRSLGCGCGLDECGKCNTDNRVINGTL